VKLFFSIITLDVGKGNTITPTRQKKTFAAIIINQHMTSSLALRCEAAREGTQR